MDTSAKQPVDKIKLAEQLRQRMERHELNPIEEKELAELSAQLEKLRQAATRLEYSKIRTEREKATFAMMMRMNPDALTAIRKEFFVREDEIVLEEFIYIIQKHLNKSTSFEGEEQREFGMKMCDLFDDIDVNGDGNLEWQEFTSFVVEKANILNKRLKSTSIPHYYDSTESLDSSAQYRHRHDISKMAPIPNLCQFAMVEDHKNAIFVFNSRLGKHLTTIQTESAPVAIEYIVQKDLLVASSADMTLSTYSMADPNHNRRYKQKSSWSTPGVQMALAYMPANQLLYSGGTNGNVYSWQVQDRSLVSTFTGHTDIVMALTVLKKLNNLASGSLDKTVNVWDSYTNARVLELQGHKKGVLGMTYNPEYRLLFSCGFEHDACVWSPFVNSLVYRFKGHHASLIGIHAIEDTPEVITADISGIFKLWDIRNYQCIQTFMANLTGSDTKDSSRLSCFFQCRLPPSNNQQKEDDSRIFAASKLLFSFDQARVVHDATTDFSIVQWVGWNPDTSNFITVSEKTVIVWDALIGTKTVTNSGIVAEEISACCLDDRKRKLIMGDVKGKIGVYNFTNGALMKIVQDDVQSVVVAIQYVDEDRRFIAGYSNGLMRIYDENSLEECNTVHTFDSFSRHPELLAMKFSAVDSTVASTGASCGIVKLWDYVAGKCEYELKVCDQSEVVCSLTFLDPYPLVATADSRGNICFWGSRGFKWVGKRLAGFLNVNTITAKPERNPKPSYDDGRFYTRIFADANAAATSNTAQVLSALAGPDDDDRTVESEVKSIQTIETLDTEASERPGPHFGPIVEKSMKLSTKQSPDLIAAAEYAELAEKTWGTALPAQCLCLGKDNTLFYTSDDLGNVKCYNLKNFFNDIGGKDLLSSGAGTHLKDHCSKVERNEISAAPPIYMRHRNFLVGRKMNAMSYYGIDFVWSLQAHHDRIVYLTTISYGVLTSGADRLVKMWNHDGTPVGVLLQSVPVGVVNQKWGMEIDAEARIHDESERLDVILNDVSELASRTDLPDIETANLDGIETGVNAAEFSRSDLRQRIEATGGNLGIDFPTESEIARRMREGEPVGDEIDPDIGNLTIGPKSKSLAAALRELKSTAPAVHYEENAQKMTHLQKRRRAAKMEHLSVVYAEKCGMKIDATANDMYRTHLPDINDSNPHDLANVNLAILSPATKVNSTTTSMSSSEKGSPTKSIKSPAGGAVSGDLGGSETGFLTPSKQQSRSHSRSVTLSPSPSRVALKSKQSPSGPRAESMRNRCNQYSSFDALEKVLDTAVSPTGKVILSPIKSTGELSPAQQAEAKRIKEFHKKLIENVTKTKSPARQSLIFSSPDSSQRTIEPMLSRNASNPLNHAEDHNESEGVVSGAGNDTTADDVSI